MKNPKLLKVLWVEDDKSIIDPYRLLAEKYDLILYQYPCWDDAKKELEKRYDHYSAIILDAKCKYLADSSDNAVEFLRESLKDIRALAEKKKRTIPWFVLTGGDSSEVSDSINVDRLNWDDDWTERTSKNYYSKNTDREELFKRIKTIAINSPVLQIQNRYKSVFDAIKKCKIGEDAKKHIEKLLIHIHFPNELSNEDFNELGFSYIRKILEYIFRSMGKYGIIPEWGNKINLLWSSNLLCGKPAKNENGSIYYKWLKDEPALPKIMAGNLLGMTNAIHSAQHSENEEDDKQKSIIPKYLRKVDFSTFLLSSYTFQLCDLILWYKNYLKDHKNIEENKKKWKKVQ